MSVTPSTLGIIPVLPSSDIERDLNWYRQYTGFEHYFGDAGYAGLKRDDLEIHLQLHRGSEEDPMPDGSVIKIFVRDILPFFEEFVNKGTIEREKLRMNTPWGTHEFGFYDLNKNAIFFVQDV